MKSKVQFNNDVIYFGFTSSTDPLLCKKEVISRYRKLAKLNHPDKHVGASEAEKEALNAAFQEMHSIYDRIIDYIDNVRDDDLSEDNFSIDFFRKNNFPKQKKSSTIVVLENEFASEWEDIMSESFGEGKPLANGVSGKIFKKDGFTITLYLMPKSDGKTKVHIQGCDVDAQ